jgi:predicted DNA-binding WGR domain protein
MEGKQFGLYRHLNADGSSKDWAIRVDGDTFTTRWGKTGHRLPQSKTKRTAKSDPVCSGLIRSKEAKGYRFVGNVLIDGDGNVRFPSRPPATVAEPETGVEEAIYWRIRIGRTLDGEAVAAFRRAAHAKLLCVEPFAPPRNDGGPFIDGWPVHGNSQAGQLNPGHGVMPLLYLMALKRSAPPGMAVSIASEDEVEISDNPKLEARALKFFGADLESVREAAEALELMQKRIDFSKLEIDLPDFSAV